LEFDQVRVAGDAGQSLGDLHDINAIAQWRGKHQADKSAFVFLADGEKEANTLTFGELHHSACSVATWLQEHELVGERVLLLYPQGVDFIIGFLGCLYAGAIAVPAYPPHPRRSDPRLEAIFEDCQPKAAFCIQKEVENLSLPLADQNLLILATDTLSPSTGAWESKSVGHDSIAYLQYTSGSTGNPKGVMVTQGNLLHQCEYLANLSGHDENMVLVSWPPFFHDMGLVGTVATIIFTGAICYVLAPAAFLRKPIRWLKAISRYRGTAATGPNFAFELCITQTTAEQREGLDLSSWKVAWNGAEPIRSDTLDRFCEVYEPFGFNRRTHFPCYGMAEVTLCATADLPSRLPIIVSIHRVELEQKQSVPGA
jgi:acyl-CoA synthetase (AMP-forming)/AMP-acid ligase II